MKLISTLVRVHILCCTLFLTFFAREASAQVCANPATTIYGLTTGGFIYPITVATAAEGPAINPAYTGNAPNQSNALGYNSLSGKFYYFKRNPSATPQEFVSFDPGTNAYAILAGCPTTNTVHTGCVSFDGLGYYCMDVNANLYYYNILLNSWKLITSKYYDQFGTNITAILTARNSGDIIVDGHGNLWILCSNSSQYGLYEIKAPIPTLLGALSLTAQQVINPTTATPNGNSFVGIAFNPTGQIYMATGTGDNVLYRLENNYSLTNMGTLPVDGSGNDLTSCSFPRSVLPVAWESYSASLLANQSVLLKWSVSQQYNNKGYRLERSLDGSSWTSFGFVAAGYKTGIVNGFSFTDDKPADGKNYYRVVAVDMDGQETYSAIKLVSMNDNGTVSLWPNPAKDVLYVQNRTTNGGYTSGAMIFDQAGRVISQVALQQGVNTINLNRLPTGTYVIRIQLSNGESLSQKLLKQ